MGKEKTLTCTAVEIKETAVTKQQLVEEFNELLSNLPDTIAEVTICGIIRIEKK